MTSTMTKLIYSNYFSALIFKTEEYIRKFEDDDDDYKYEEVPVEDFYENG